MEHSKEAQDQGPRNIKIRGNGAYTGKRPIDRVPSRLVSFCPIVSNRGIQIDKFRIPTRLFTNV